MAIVNGGMKAIGRISSESARVVGLAEDETTLLHYRYSPNHLPRPVPHLASLVGPVSISHDDRDTCPPVEWSQSDHTRSFPSYRAPQPRRRWSSPLHPNSQSPMVGPHFHPDPALSRAHSPLLSLVQITPNHQERAQWTIYEVCE